MAEQVVKLGLVQMPASPSKADNLRRTLARVREAAERGAQLVCLQELFASTYFCQTEDADAFDLAEPIPGPTLQAVAQVARECGVVVVAPVFERRAAGLYHNTAVVIGPTGGQLGMYRKMHIPDDPGFYEKFYFAPGDLGFVVIETPFGRVAPLICWDQWYPEAARLTALRGAELLVYPTAVGWLPAEPADSRGAQLSAWQTIQRSHAIANGVFVASINRVGCEPGPAGGIEFWGHSFVCDPLGEVLAEAGAVEELLIVQCDWRKQEAIRRDWPFLRDRRVDAYQGITARLLDRGRD
jgi:N-carbamoylputrescine amidase